MGIYHERTPNIEELRTFCLAAELGSLGRAAVRLHVSQPCLSKRRAHLEAAAGTVSLRRRGTGDAGARELHGLIAEMKDLVASRAPRWTDGKVESAVEPAAHQQ